MPAPEKGQAFYMMNNPRRKFIKMGAMLSVGSAFMPLQFCSPAKKEESVALETSEEAKSKLESFGIQLYSVKDEMAADAKATMTALAGFGYSQFEGFDGGKGVLWGMKPAEFKSLTTDLGVKMVASHANVFENLDTQAEEAKEAGLEYLICPWIGAQKTIDEYKIMAEKFNQAGETLKSHGLKFAYHNHDYTFEMLEGVLPQDVLMDNTDPALVDFEMDMYWVYVAGVNPAEYLAKYPRRFKLCHLKDAESDQGNGEERGVLFGSGEIPFEGIVKDSKSLGMEYFIIEQERFVNTTPMEAAEKNAAYLKNTFVY
ncbi:sugar phosphate isomerase/epimerase family protein [Algoriphagus lutimaris]|uniref:sugar phosphate isomerase/epimerase family protein n=1 Tax=Algoriphagus lutimaris TaxID=613197 RepID=UPI001FAF8996|nr:sugar phosphate isomerase/epimerase [Algoriphagus lutimaris]